MMVISIVGKDVEYHTTIQFLTVHFRQMQFTTHGKELFVAVGFRIHCSQSLSVQLARLIAVKAFCKEMVYTIHLQQS